MPLIKCGPVNYGNGNALSIALPVFSNLPWSFFGRPTAGGGFKPASEFRRNQETETIGIQLFPRTLPSTEQACLAEPRPRGSNRTGRPRQDRSSAERARPKPNKDPDPLSPHDAEQCRSRLRSPRRTTVRTTIHTSRKVLSP